MLKFKTLVEAPDILNMYSPRYMIHKTLIAPIVFTAIFALSGCATVTSSEINVPSPSPQSAPTPSPSESVEDVELAEPNGADIADAINSEIRESSEFKSIMISLEDGTNAERFEAINILLGAGFIDRALADQIYFQAENGEYETLAYQIYLYQKSLEK